MRAIDADSYLTGMTEAAGQKSLDAVVSQKSPLPQTTIMQLTVARSSNIILRSDMF